MGISGIRAPVLLALGLLCLSAQAADLEEEQTEVDVPPAPAEAPPELPPELPPDFPPETPAAPEPEAPAVETPPPPPHRLSYEWNTLSGDKLKVPWPVASAWVWDRAPEGISARSPRLRTWVQLPGGFRLVSMERTSDFELVRHPSDSPFREWTTDAFAVDLAAPSGQGTLLFKDAKGETAFVVLKISSEYSAPATLFDTASCDPEGIRVESAKIEGRFLYAGVSCHDDGDAVSVFVFRSSDAVWAGSDIPGNQSEGRGWRRFVLPKTKQKFFDERAIGRFTIREAKGSASTESVVLYRPPGRRSLARWNIGLGTTYINYSEELRDISLTMLALTAKTGIDLTFFPSWIDLGVGGYMTVTSYRLESESSANLVSPTFYGLNARIGMRFSDAMGVSEQRVLIGYYHWGMLVSDRSYGVRRLTGPQIFFMARKSQLRRPTYYGYVKLAPLSDNFGSISLPDREVAIGLGYQINNPRRASATWMLTLDLSDTRFHSEEASNGIELQTATLGIQLSL